MQFFKEIAKKEKQVIAKKGGTQPPGHPLKLPLNYCPLIWMIHSRLNKNGIKYLHQRCPSLIYTKKPASNEEVLERDGSVSIQHKKNWNICS